MKNWILKPLLAVVIALPVFSTVQVQSADAGHKNRRAAIIAGAIVGGAIAYNYHRNHRKYRKHRNHYRYGIGHHHHRHYRGSRYYRGQGTYPHIFATDGYWNPMQRR